MFAGPPEHCRGAYSCCWFSRLARVDAGQARAEIRVTRPAWSRGQWSWPHPPGQRQPPSWSRTWHSHLVQLKVPFEMSGEGAILMLTSGGMRAFDGDSPGICPLAPFFFAEDRLEECWDRPLQVPSPINPSSASRGLAASASSLWLSACRCLRILGAPTRRCVAARHACLRSTMLAELPGRAATELRPPRD